MVQRIFTRGLRRAVLMTSFASALLLPATAVAAQGLLLDAPPAAQSFRLPPADIGTAPILVAQSQEAAQLMIRVQDLEGQLRELTGLVERLQLQVRQLEAGMQQLQGGAAPQAAAPVEALPPAPQPSAVAELPAAPAAPLDLTMGQSADPLLNGGNGQLGTLSEADRLSLDPARPLNLSLDGGTISNGDANAQYAAGYEAMVRGDYAFAEDQFTQFVALYPDDPQAPDATNWLGEALIQRGAYTDAAQVLADGYTKHRESPRAPDMMLRLGIALAGAEQTDVACRTFSTLGQRYPDLSPAFKQRLGEETSKAQCPAG
jgi:tol-pal system protein YbgF